MTNLFTQLQEELDQQLAILEKKYPNLLERYKTGAGIASKTIASMKELITAAGFRNDEEEIFFFKHIHPKILSRKIYYSRLFQIEADKIRYSRDAYKRFLDQELEHLSAFIETHSLLSLYYNQESTDKDKEYFLRNSQYNNEYPDDLDDMLDVRYCTLASVKLAELIANEDIREYLMKKIQEVYEQIKRGETLKPKPQWTMTKADLVELIYALGVGKCFNNGDVELKQLFDALGDYWGVDLSHAHTYMRDIRERKKDKTSFLSYLLESLRGEIEKDEEAEG